MHNKSYNVFGQNELLVVWKKVVFLMRQSFRRFLVALSQFSILHTLRNLRQSNLEFSRFELLSSWKRVFDSNCAPL